MKQVKKIVCALLLAALVFAMPTAAFASEDGSMWLCTTETSDSTTVHVVTDATVTDGLVEIAYDVSALTYQNLTVSEEYVAMYSVNAETPGSVKISWVAPNAYPSDGKGISLISVNFSGVEEKSSVALSGTGNKESGSDVLITEAPDFVELEKAILEAEGLNKNLYTKKTYDVLKDALVAARAVFENPISSQKEIDSATKLLTEAMDNLVLLIFDFEGSADTSELEKAIAKAEGLDESKYTKKSFKEVEKELKDAKAVLANRNSTQLEVDAAAKDLKDAIAALKLLSEEYNPSTGVESMMNTVIVMAVLSAAGIVIFGKKFMRRAAK